MQSDRERPTFTAEELREIAPEEDIDAALDAEEARGNAEMRRLGMSDDEIVRARGKASPAELAKPAPTLREVEQEIDELMGLRRSDRRKYWSDAVQARHLALIELQQKLKADSKPADAASEDDIAADDLPLPESLKAEWRKSPGGVEDALQAIRSRTILALAHLDDDESDALKRSFDDDLDAEEHEAIVGGLAEDSGRWPTASAEEVSSFAELDHGQILVSEWGQQAPALLGRARREAEAMLSRLSPVARARTERWAMSRPPAQRVAIIRALAARGQRKL